MQLRDIAAISGKPGLFRILKPTRSGVIIETLDEKRQRTVAGAASRVSILNDISMYTTDSEGSVPLGEVLMRVHEAHKGKPLSISAKADGADLEDFMRGVLPNWDAERVYTSDIKKLVTWYNLLVQHAPDLFKKEEEEAPKAEAAAAEKSAKGKKTELKEGPSAAVVDAPAEEEAKPKKATAKKKDEAPKADATMEEKPRKAAPKKAKE